MHHLVSPVLECQENLLKEENRILMDTLYVLKVMKQKQLINLLGGVVVLR